MGSNLNTYLSELESKRTPHFESAAEICAQQFEPLRQPLQGLIVEGLTLFVGASKIGKSWFMLQLCCAVAMGTDFLGRKTERGPVLYLALEDSQRRISERMKKLALPAPDSLKIWTRPTRADDTLFPLIDNFLAENADARLIVVDTLQKVRGVSHGGVNIYEADYAFMGRLQEFAGQRRIAVVLVHHFSKLKGRDLDDPFDRVSGSTGLTGAADSTLLLFRKRGETEATLTFTGRDIHGPDLKLRLTENMHWCLCSAEESERAAYERQPVVKALRLFAAQPSLTGTHRASYEDFRQWAGQNGIFLGTNAQQVHKLLEAQAENFERFDGLHLTFGIRIGKGVGFNVGRL